MADTDDWGGVPVNNQVSQSDDWGGVPIDNAPKLPDTTGIQQTVQKNLQADSENTQPQSFNEKVDKGIGMPVSSALKGGDQNTPLPQDIRGHLVDSYRNGTSQNAGDYMQSALPAVAKTVSSGNQPDYTDVIQQAFIRGFKSNLEAAKQTGQAISGQIPENSPEQNDNIQPYLTAPYKMGWPDFKKIVGKTLYGLTESSPEIGGAVAGGMAGVAAAGGPEDPTALITGPLGSGIGAAGVHAVKSLAPTYAAQLKANNGDQDAAWSATKKMVSIGSAGTGASMALFGFNPFENAVKNTLFQVFGVQSAIGATQQAATNVATGKPLLQGTGQAAIESGAGAAVPLSAHLALGGLSGTGHEDLRPMVAEATGKPIESITPQDIDQVVSTAFKDKAPHAQDFTNVATVLEGGENIEQHTNTLHNIYKETGVAPDQVYSDAQENPQIAADIADGKVPSAYDHLRSLPEDTGISKTESVSSELPEQPKTSESNEIIASNVQPSEKQNQSVEGASRANPLSQVFNPAGISESAKDMATALRQAKGPQARDTAVLQDKLEPYAKDINKMSDDERLDLIDYMENRSKGSEIPNPKLQAVADAIKDSYQFMAEKVQKAFPDTGLREDYFTHQYKDEAAAKKFFGDFVSKQGSERNLQKRAYPTLKEAMDAGLEPKTTNPLETVMNYVNNMNNLITAQRGVDLSREGGVANYFEKGQQPEGWVPLNGNLAEEGSKVLYAPEDAARVYNNDISEKASGPLGSMLDAYNHGKNFADKLILGLSGYHFTATTMASMASDVGRALTGGSLGERASDIASSVTPFSNTKFGSKIEDAYLGRSDLSPELQKALDLAIKNNAINVKQQDYWKAGPAKDWVDSFKTGSIGSELKEAGNTIKQQPLLGTAKVIAETLGKTMDTISKPLFDYYIPRIKNAALIGEVHDWLQKNPDADPKVADRKVQEIGNSIDNRFGEMMRDNLFWHQYTRQTLQTALLSYSWVTGAARMLKGIPDTAMTIMNKGELTSNAKYLFGMAATYAIVNGARTYLGTGQVPNNYMDFIFPRTGGTTPQGKPERELLPSHIGQFTNYLHEGIGELGNEADPVLKLLYHLSTNQDFRGLPITNGNNKWFSEQRWEDYLKFTLGEVSPIGLKTFLLGHKKGSEITGVESALGARQAPSFITDPEGYEHMMENVNNRNFQRKERSDKKLANQYESSDE